MSDDKIHGYDSDIWHKYRWDLLKCRKEQQDKYDRGVMVVAITFLLFTAYLGGPGAWLPMACLALAIVSALASHLMSALAHEKAIDQWDAGAKLEHYGGELPHYGGWYYVPIPWLNAIAGVALLNGMVAFVLEYGGRAVAT